MISFLIHLIFLDEKFTFDDFLSDFDLQDFVALFRPHQSLTGNGQNSCGISGEIIIDKK